MNTVDELIGRLSGKEQILGLVAFGASSMSYEGRGDYDLLAVLAENETVVRSLHFWCGNTPIDLNIRTLAELRNVDQLPHFDQAMLEGRLILDRTGLLADILGSWRRRAADEQQVSIHDDRLARIRLWHRHVIEKVKGRPEPFGRFLLFSNLGWLTENYFRVRRLPYRGPKASWDWLDLHEPIFRRMLEAATGTVSFEDLVGLTEQMTELVLRPVGGPWRYGEMIACGTEESVDLTNQGLAVYQELLGS